MVSDERERVSKQLVIAIFTYWASSPMANAPHHIIIINN
jgi:hypothetical protein